MSTTYYALVGVQETPETASGLIRRTDQDNGTVIIERFVRGTWVRDDSAMKYFVGLNDDAEEITKEQAEELAKRNF